MKYLLDTNICIYTINKKNEALMNKLSEIQISDMMISSLTVAELYYGVEKSIKKNENLSSLNYFLLPFDIINFDSSDAMVYGRIRNELRKAGTPIGSNDLLIASQAISRDLILVSNNEKEFQRVPNIKLESWT
ncbi:MAG: type II toxin-antitoxin system VapC family toxin [Ignavibacteria bacterium]|nr:type II toxin-antitoxin system VapC family toxin [Ignavibacteria bacterium]